jgi:hypothetical protein
MCHASSVKPAGCHPCELADDSAIAAMESWSRRQMVPGFIGVRAGIQPHISKVRNTSSAKWRCDRRVRPAAISRSISQPRYVCRAKSPLRNPSSVSRSAQARMKSSMCVAMRSVWPPIVTHYMLRSNLTREHPCLLR